MEGAGALSTSTLSRAVLNELLTEVSDYLSSRALARRITLSTALTSQSPRVGGDRIQLRCSCHSARRALKQPKPRQATAGVLHVAVLPTPIADRR
jgi:hypothetical protein